MNHIVRTVVALAGMACVFAPASSAYPLSQAAEEILNRYSLSKTNDAAITAMTDLSDMCQSLDVSANVEWQSLQSSCVEVCTITNDLASAPPDATLNRMHHIRVWNPCRKTAGSLFAKIDLSGAEVERQEAAAEAAQAEAARQAKVAAHEYVPLPASLTTVPLIAFNQQTVANLKSNYVQGANNHQYLSATCYEEAFDYVLSSRYWTELEESVQFINNEIAAGSFPNSFGPVTVESAPALCQDPDFVARLNVGRGGGVGLMRKRICVLAGPGGQQAFVPDVSHLGLRTGTICVDRTALYESEQANCLNSAGRMTSFGVHSDAESYCECSAQKRSIFFDGNDQSLSSQTLNRSAVDSRTYCRSNTQ